MFQNQINEQIQRVRRSPYAALLGEQVYSRLEKTLQDMAGTVSKSTLNREIAKEASEDNPFALSLPEMITDEERRRAIDTIEKKLARGEYSFPKPLAEFLHTRLGFATDAFLEMLERIAENRKEICAVLTDGRLYRKIEDVQLFTGDTHNHGRSVTVLHTDTGKMVYKPHDMRGDAHIYAIARKFFPEFAGIPRCAAFGDSFGVCEFIEKQRSEGEEEARSFWYHMGGMAAFIKLLGSTDMHIENLSCKGGKPYILDLETILSPIRGNEDYTIRQPELCILKGRSPYLSCLLPNSPKGREYSVFMNNTGEGCAPLVNGKPALAAAYMGELLDGYDTAYRRAIDRRGEIAEMIRDIPDTVPFRILMRDTQFYVNHIDKLYHHTTLASEENREHTKEVLSKIMAHHLLPGFENTAAAEVRQMLRGDVPYVYTAAGSTALFSDGETLREDVFEKTAKEHALENLFAMDEADERSDLSLIERAIRQYPVRISEDEKTAGTVLRQADAPLSTKAALDEAERMLEEAYALHIPGPDGRKFWGYVFEGDSSFRFCEVDLSSGLAGFAVFAAACLRLSNHERVRQMAREILQETVLDLGREMEYIRFRNYDFDFAPPLGESTGTAGILTALELMRRYAPLTEFEAFDLYIGELLEKTDFTRYGVPDRMIGMAGFLSALCRFDRYRGKKEVIRKAADSLLAMKTLPYEGKLLWKTLPDTPRPISGAGHGHAGVAEALYAAAGVLGDEKYAAAASEALDFERAVYEKYCEKFGTWADLRSYPPEGIMHGYCSGAPGIGIMIERIRQAGFDSENIQRLARYARESVDRMHLNSRDHLCCGNSAIVEYYLSTGRREDAGRVLAAMAERRKKEGEYRFMAYQFNNSMTPSLFYGISGAGYEMLRYACPDQIISVL
ncbi:MAG: DUF4135 domain-containing protein [Clostridia bacterium]|nr:DUF4135 domain-containing protein [Clostridia bacterium]